MNAAQQQKVLAMFAALDPDGRRYAMGVLELEYDRVQRARRPVLRMVRGGRAPVGRVGGFITSGTALGLAGLSFLAATTYALMPRQVAEPAPPPAATPGAGVAYAPFVFVDQVTGCQYLSTHLSAGLAPRIAADGKTHMGCKGGGL